MSDHEGYCFLRGSCKVFCVPVFDANISLMFPDVPLLERFAAARACGFEGVEILNPYQASLRDLATRLKDNGLQLVLINTPMGDVAAGERGAGCLPGRESEFKRHFETALHYAVELGVGRIHVMAGVVPEEHKRRTCVETMVRNVQWAARLAAAEKVDLLLEPLNVRDVPGYLYATSEAVMDVITAIGEANVKLQFDFYHVQIMEGDIGERISTLFREIGHVQFSSVPGRYEPQYGEVNVYPLFEQLDALGYAGWVGCEYRPLGDTREGLSWAKCYDLG